MLSPSLPASFSSSCRRELALAGLLASVAFAPPAQSAAALAPTRADIRLELSPRICTLGIKDRQCEARVQATWRSPTEESLCLVIEGRPEVKQCWEKYDKGTYTIELVFSDDLLFELKDLELQRVLAAETLRVIREAIQYRHKRRQPWNVFD
jgi:hypothetical protein